MMKELSTRDLFYNLDDVINLFKQEETKKYKGKKIIQNYNTWTGDSNDKMRFYIK